jgi:hypothetical protein
MAEDSSHNSKTDQDVVALKPYFDRAIEGVAPISQSFIYMSTIDKAGVALRYCFEYRDEVNNQWYATVSSVISKFGGRLEWKTAPQFNNMGMCIYFIPEYEIRKLFSGEMPGKATISFKEVSEDAVRLCTYMSRTIATAGHIVPGTSSRSTLPDPYAPGMHAIYVLRVPESGVYAGLYETDRELHFSPNTQEWKGLLAAILGGTSRPLEAEPFKGPRLVIPEFPLLSRIQSPYDRAIYSSDELQYLREECGNALRLVSPGPAKGALEKVLAAVDWAEQLSSGLLFDPLD